MTLATALGLNLLQLAFVTLLAPLFSGIASRWRENIQFKRGPSIWQPYRDLVKLFFKEERFSESGTWIRRFAPYAVCLSPMLVTLLIPVVTDFPLFGAFAGDMLSVGFILSIGGFFLALAAVDGGVPYGTMGASRTRMVSFLAEPVLIVTLFTVSFVANSTIPYVVQQQWITPPAHFFSPAHVLVLCATFMLIIAESGRLPVDNPTGHFELAMIDESKVLDYSGPSFALLKWGGFMKTTVLGIICVNVLFAPWGLASTPAAGSLLIAIAVVFLKILVLLAALVIVETSVSKLRLFRIAEYLGVAFVVAVTAMIAAVLVP
ncbi:MAG: respiratory chain complex I subunit 1 family protein [Vulcanimicrobiaceae bacterium]